MFIQQKVVNWQCACANACNSIISPFIYQIQSLAKWHCTSSEDTQADPRCLAARHEDLLGADIGCTLVSFASAPFPSSVCWVLPVCSPLAVHLQSRECRTWTWRCFFFQWFLEIFHRTSRVAPRRKLAFSWTNLMPMTLTHARMWFSSKSSSLPNIKMYRVVLVTGCEVVL